MSDDRSGPPDRPAADDPWIESRAGGLFFVNAVLVGPELMVLVPLVAGLALRAAGILQGPSRFIDTIPRVAAYVLPWVGGLVVVPLWTCWRNLRMENVKPWARAALYGMIVVHTGFLAYTVSRWLGAGG